MMSMVTTGSAATATLATYSLMHSGRHISLPVISTVHYTGATVTGISASMPAIHIATTSISDVQCSMPPIVVLTPGICMVHTVTTITTATTSVLQDIHTLAC